MNDRILQLIAEIDEFKGFWNGMQSLPEASLQSLRRFATIESVGSSTRIEGARLTDAEVAVLLAGIDIQSFRTRDEQEAAGYADAMRVVYESWRHMELTESMIRSLHKTLLQHSAKDEWHLGNYKTLANHVAAFDEQSKQIGVVFETASPFETPQAMAALVEATRRTLENRERHPLLSIGEFVVHFLAIHPFQDGNGRLSRVLTTLLLLRAGYDYVPFNSLERLVEANKARYYQALRNSQVTDPKESADTTAWLEFFLEMLMRQKELLRKAIEREQRVAVLPSPLSEILEIAREHGSLQVADVVRVQSIGRNTAKKRLQRLVELGELHLIGKGRGARYRPK